MKAKITAKRLVRALYLETIEHKMNAIQKVNYFLYGYDQVIKEGLDQLEYWRCALIACPEIVDEINKALYDKDINPDVKKFISKMALLK